MLYLMIPEWDPLTGNLPEGVHQAEWTEVVDRLGFTKRRLELLTGLQSGLSILREYGCEQVWLDGSFVSDKPEPGDFDCCWDHASTRFPSLVADHPIFFDFSNGRRAQKQRFGGEFFLAHDPAEPAGTVFLDFFQRDKFTGDRKGVLLFRPSAFMMEIVVVTPQEVSHSHH